MRAATQTVLLYVAFAAVATAVNIGTQFIVFQLVSGSSALWIGMIAGTATGLIIKYALDKVWIFNDRETGFRQHAEKFSRYSFIGLGTTGIFWITELSFAAIGPWEGWRYIGALVGLSIGYTIKYFADRRFVFVVPS